LTTREQTSVEDSGGLDLLSLWPVLWGYKYLIFLTVLIGALVAAAMALTATPIFRGEAVITEVRESGMSASSSLTSQFGGLASLAGISLGGDGPDRERQAILQSRRLAEEFVKRKNLLPALAAGAEQKPSLWQAVEQFRTNVLTVHEDKLKGITTVDIDWTDPVIAARWANEFVATTNDVIRARALNDSTRNIAYHNEQLAKTTVVEVRRVMYSLIENETKTLMLANARAEYAFTVVDPAVAPERRISPKRALMVTLGIVVGIFVGVLLALIHFSVHRRKAKSLQA